MTRARCIGAILVSLLVPVTASAASYVVPSDRELVEAADAVVVAKVLSMHSRFTASGLIVTDHAVRVDDVLKGSVAAGETIRVTEVGGVVGDLGLIASSSPRFVAGESALLLLDRSSDGAWSTHSGQLGKFNFVRDASSALLLVRGARDEEIFGWDVHGAPHAEPTRDAAAFLDFIRATARGESPDASYLRAAAGATRIESDAVEAFSSFSPNAYLMQFGFTNPGGARWQAGGFTMATQGTPTGTTAAAVAQTGASTWNDDPTSDIAIAIGGSASAVNYGGSNDVNVVHFGVPSTFTYTDDDGKIQTPLSGNVVGQALLWASSAQHQLRGESFYTSAECDIILETSLTGNVLREVAAHEMGHCLGFRHSNEGDPNTGDALMNSFASGRAPELRDWDREAANSVYGDGTYNTCVAPAILAQTASRTIATGQSLTLAVLATGTDLTYQWYRGAAGTETQPVAGATSSQLETGDLTTTASYWVKVGSACGTVNSATITVTVSPTATSPRRRAVRR